MNRTSIGWCDFSANPIRFRAPDGRVVWACEKVSAGCQNCYAEALSRRYPQRRAGDWNAATMKTLEPFLDEQELRRMLTYKPASGKRVFVGDMTDIFGEWVEQWQIAQLFGVMALRYDVTWQVLTKRADWMRALLADDGFRQEVDEWITMLSEGDDGCDPLARTTDDLRANAPDVLDGDWPLSNVWLGVSCEDQQRADERIPLLLQTPAAVRFISAEPLLGPIDLRPHGLNSSYTMHVSADVEGLIEAGDFSYLTGDDGRPLSPAQAERDLRALSASGVKRIQVAGTKCDGFSDQTGCPRHSHPRVDWVIVGGESGPSARNCSVDWIRSLVSQCTSADVPCFVKQLGSAPLDWLKAEPTGEFRTDPETGNRQIQVKQPALKDRKGGDPFEWSADLCVREFPRSAVTA